MKFYIAIKGYCDTTLRVYEEEADTYEEALKQAQNEYLSELDFESVSEKEYHKYKNELGDEPDYDDEEDEEISDWGEDKYKEVSW